jgi:tetratricopeptide (TPR) repeat protein
VSAVRVCRAHRPTIVLVVLILATPRAAIACHPARTAGAPSTPVVLMPGLGAHHHAIATTNPEAQRFFDQGLSLVFAFNHDEAIRAFERASELDPHAIMPHWGMALALGPNINLDIDPERERAAWTAMRKALALAPHASARERAYVEALAPRYSPDPRAHPTKRAVAYKDAMRTLSERYPDDLDAATLYAESLMNLRPWKLWGPDGQPAEGTREIVAVLESVLHREPQHLGANHYFIHALEMSPHPERALASAKRLETLAPAAGHLLHMPSHVYMRTGDYLGAARSNEAADAADRAYIRARKPAGLYPLMYSIHNVHFLNAAEAMAGRGAAARKAAARVIADVKPQVIADETTRPLADFYASTPYLTALRFQRWNDVLDAPRPDSRLLVTTALWHFARGVARVARSEVAAAQQERTDFAAARTAVPTDALLNLNRAHDVLAVAAAVLDARIAAGGGDHAAAIAAWRTAVERQDALSYDEPPAWHAPVRESLGAALFIDGQYADAEQVFRADLTRNPRNGRSLFGLAKTLEARGETASASTAWGEFERAWKDADVRLRMEDL